MAPPVEGMQHAGKSPTGTPNEAWLSIDLLQVLCYLFVEPAHQPVVRLMLQNALNECPEVLLVSMAAVPPMEWSLLQREVFSLLLPLHLSSNSPVSQAVLRRLWAGSPTLVVEALVEYVAQDGGNLPRVLDICQDLQALNGVLSLAPYAFSLELAVLAASRSQLDLEQWATELMTQDAVHFVTALLAFMDVRIAPEQPPGQVPLAESSVRALLRALQPMRGQIPGDVGQLLKKVQEQVVRRFPALAPLVSGNEPFASEVEDEANNHFQKIYSQEEPIEEVVQLLQSFKASNNAHEQEVFACMIHNLFDEYRFFPRYPDKELHITALLFGALVGHQLVSSITLGMALRYVQEALAKPPGSKMYAFGTVALRQFVGIAHLWPQFCTRVLQIPHLRKMDSDLYQRVQQSMRDHGHPVPTLPEDSHPSVAAAAAAAANSRGGLPGAVVAATSVGSGLGSLPPGIPTQTTPGQQGTAPTTAAAAAARACEAPGITGPYQAWLTGGRAGAAAAPTPNASTLMQAHSNAAAGNGAAVGGVTALPAGASAAATDGDSGGNSKMQSLGDGEGADQVGRALADEVAASSLQPMSTSSSNIGTSRPPTLAALVTTESLESAAEKADKGKAPPESVQDRVHFLINNLTEDTVALRASEIKAKVVPEFMEWFANYLVVKRAAQEANYHRLYIALVDKVSDKELMRLLSRTTHYYVHVLLHSERIVKESNDRALLKNLGVWLGLLTLARNKPILSKELELKAVVVDAYQRGRLIAVLPFITKLLECCKGSKIFTPTNPMIAGILSLLAELHGMKGLKINNVFSIELVFRAFDVNVQDVKPTDLLRHLLRERLQNQDWSVDALPQEAPQTPTRTAAPLHAPLPGTPPPAGTPFARTPLAASQAPAAAMASPSNLPPNVLAAMAGMHPPASPTPLTPGARPDTAAGAAAGRTSLEVAAGDAGMAPGGAATPAMPGAPIVPSVAEAGGLLSQLPTYVVISPSLAALSERMGLKRAVPLAVERGVQEILAPVVERSVTIACFTAVELVVKDFAVDPDENRMRSAAHLMVSSLAGSLALVTCKDPLRVALANHMRALLQAVQASVMDAGVIEQVVGVVVADNLDLGCVVIERAATEKAVRDVDKLLAGAYEERAKARAMGKHFADDSAFQGRFPRDLPESLRPRPGMVSPLQLRVYDDFARIPRTPPPVVPPVVPPTAIPAAAPGLGPRPFGGPYAEGGAGVPAAPGADGLAAAFKLAEPSSVASAVFLEQYLVWQGHADTALASAEATAVAASAANTAGGAAAAAAASQRASAEEAALNGLLRELVDAVTSVGVHEEAAHFFAHRIFRHLFEVAVAATPVGAKRACSFYTSCLRHLVEILGSKGVVLNMTASWLTMDDERKYNKEAVEALLRGRLLALTELDSHLAKMLTLTRSFMVADLISHIAKVCLLRDKVVAFQDFAASLDALARFSSAARAAAAAAAPAASAAPPAAGGPPGVPPPAAPLLPPGIAEAHLAVVEQARKVGALDLVPNRPLSELPAVVRDRNEAAGQREQARALFEEWLRLLSSFPGALAVAAQHGTSPVTPAVGGTEADRAAVAAFLTALRASGALSTDESAERWMRTTLEIAVGHTLAIRDQTAAAGRVLEASVTYMAVDALARLLVCCVTQASASGQALLSRLLAVVVGCIKREADDKTMAFDGRPYLRFLTVLSSELGNVVSADGSETASIGFLRAVAVALHMLQPLSVPGFALCWLEAISHRAVMPRLLRSPQAQGWALYEGLLLALLRFMEPYLRVADLSAAMRAMYTGTLRLLLVLLHDFPEFLSEHHFSLCNHIPPTCVQMRNLILSAFPRNMRLPDPFTPNLKVDLLPEIGVPPRLANPDRLLPDNIKRQVDGYLRTRQPRSLMQDLMQSITLPANEVAAAGTHYNVHLINGLVLYMGTVVHPSAIPLNGPAMDIYTHLVGHALWSQL
uniref:CCR4-NOT transcription complex subunit 1 n=1 Tax=Dunaliella tertiolecta TaxID=3047 RepID=A0A7S3VNL4_DUNTE